MRVVDAGVWMEHLCESRLNHLRSQKLVLGVGNFPVRDSFPGPAGDAPVGVGEEGECGRPPPVTPSGGEIPFEPLNDGPTVGGKSAEEVPELPLDHVAPAW